jgi:tetratricopeptide (TPR) repeat protein
VLLANRFEKEAELCFARAEELNPKEPRWPYFQGVILAGQDAEAAIAKLRRAVMLCSDDPDAPRLRLADALATNGRNDEARELYRHILERTASHPVAHLGLARLDYDESDLQDSLAHLKQSCSSVYSRKASRALLAVIYQRLGDRKAAAQELQAVDSLPDDAAWPDPYEEENASLHADKQTRLKQATQLLLRNRTQEGMASLGQLTRDYPEWEPPWTVLGIALLQQNAASQAETALRKATQLAPDSVQAFYQLGCAASLEGKLELALSSFRRATQLKPDHALAQFNLGQCLKQSGDRAGAIAAFRTVVRTRPYLADAHQNLGALLAASGQKPEALKYLKQALELNPDDLKTKRLLEEVQTSSEPPKGPKY